ncbi:hypothetical protein [Marinitenerispora sediminis]|uniref:Uncharacterized protein n=1 Tax=Marinitenerispora sediminis TaxID=1931232 RepID=A0A368T1Z0_9ACTN|nr:hypothetical protein [Marinitenerispora sediminis]RCV48890.1 hypothetical protein DEF28_22360 [Marinitenerispora sediminis]RCV51340.1 hypothetical protein DEF23_20645 [Marinitenerispora sediminis]RCV54927.1 hypothetical protein DEF24_18665 [Marinitenerispora sediminis]
MTDWWMLKRVGTMTARELTAALEHVAHLSPDDAALEMALRHELTLAATDEWIFGEDDRRHRAAA